MTATNCKNRNFKIVFIDEHGNAEVRWTNDPKVFIKNATRDIRIAKGELKGKVWDSWAQFKDSLNVTWAISGAGELEI
jgi:hypothetical protein